MNQSSDVAEVRARVALPNVPQVREIETWRDALRDHFGCEAVLRGIAHVREEYAGRVLWEGDVGAFELAVERAGAIAYVLTWADATSQSLRVYPLLHAGIVDSPQAAARAVIVHEFERRRG